MLIYLAKYQLNRYAKSNEAIYRQILIDLAKYGLNRYTKSNEARGKQILIYLASASSTGIQRATKP